MIENPSDLVTEGETAPETAPHRTTPGGDPGSDAHRAPPRAPARTREGQTPSDRTAPTPHLVTAGHPRGGQDPGGAGRADDDTEAAPAGGWIPPLEEDMTDDDLTGGDLEATVEAPVIHAVALPRGQEGRAPGRVWEVLVGDVPSPWSEPPAELAALVRYAADGAWCAPEAAGWRRAGQVYCWAVAIPVSTAAYLLAWLFQRPARLAALGVLGLIVWLAVLR